MTQERRGREERDAPEQQLAFQNPDALETAAQSGVAVDEEPHGDCEEHEVADPAAGHDHLARDLADGDRLLGEPLIGAHQHVGEAHEHEDACEAQQLDAGVAGGCAGDALGLEWVGWLSVYVQYFLSSWEWCRNVGLCCGFDYVMTSSSLRSSRMLVRDSVLIRSSRYQFMHALSVPMTSNDLSDIVIRPCVRGRHLDHRLHARGGVHGLTPDPAFPGRELVDPDGEHLVAGISQRPDRAPQATAVLDVMVDRGLLLIEAVAAADTPVDERLHARPSRFGPLRVPACEHRARRVSKLVDHRHRTAVVPHVQLHGTDLLLPRVRHY